MTVEQIFSALASHMIKGMMVHDQMVSYYRFLGLDGYAACHEYHFLEETHGYMKLNKYYTHHFSKIVQQVKIENPNLIPTEWIGHTREDVDTQTKRKAVKLGLETWITWEKDTKALYQNMYKQLMNINEAAAALFISQYVCDVDCQLKKAQQYYLDKKAIDFSISDIISQQKNKKHKYEKALS